MNFAIHYGGIMVALLAIMIPLLLWFIVRWSRSSKSAIRLEELLIGDNGKISSIKTVMLGSYVMTTWVIVYLTLTMKLSVEYYAAYLTAWVAPVVANILKGPTAEIPK